MTRVIKKFGNWEVTDSSIEFNNHKGEKKYQVEKGRWWETDPFEPHPQRTIWHLPIILAKGDQDWLTLDDLADFNAALHFAQEHFIELKPNEITWDIYNIWHWTSSKQGEIIKTKLNPALEVNITARKAWEEAGDPKKFFEHVTPKH